MMRRLRFVAALPLALAATVYTASRLPYLSAIALLRSTTP